MAINLSTLSSGALAGPTGATGATGFAGATGSVRYNPRVLTASTATPTINTDNCDAVTITVNSTITSMTTNLTGSPVEGQKLIISITPTGTQGITWGSSFESSTVSLPTSLTGSVRTDIGFIYNSTTSKWRCVAVV
jgi:hypothetical protein